MSDFVPAQQQSLLKPICWTQSRESAAQQPTFVSAEFVKHICGAAATDDYLSQGGLDEALLHCMIKHC